ncbi:putative histone-lysine N-methyltransferase PRDM6 [Galleria mellonella]|uniref:Histone-lysine N-methyltransferase PRDM6 n=1 Tax=Galleria mellonella TaxID=7137 RepID=A0ABM3MAK1_GALME|nr:putative histone-lysine N-methyltransferase PRDM6 [Galleria mellonella]
MYCWQLYDGNNKRRAVVDAKDPNASNWMRYVNCARHWREQNLVAYQYRGQIYYRTIKIIPRFTELMVFYGSEFANMLYIDLGKYNSPPGYAAKYGVPSKKQILKNNAKKTTPENNNTNKENEARNKIVSIEEVKNQTTLETYSEKSVKKHTLDSEVVTDD